MQQRQLRTKTRIYGNNAKFNVLLLEPDANYSLLLKQIIEDHLPVDVTIVRTIEIAKKLLQKAPNQFFISITSVLNLDSSAFE